MILLNVWTDFNETTNRKLLFQVWRKNGIYICPVCQQRVLYFSPAAPSLVEGHVTD